MRVSAVIVAAGRGVRMRAAENKVLLSLGRIPILTRTLVAFGASPRVSEVIVVVRAGEEESVASLVPSVMRRRTQIVQGGTERRDSALAGVRAATGELVLIHDGARPLVSIDLIARVIDGAAEHGACVPVIPAVDTARWVDEAGFLLSDGIERRGLVHIQTPQGFRTELIRRCLAEAGEASLSDDAAAVLACGERVATVEGEWDNLKITTPADLALAEAHLARREGRVARSTRSR